MKLDAAWHVWVLVALAVVVDGMLAVSAQCGCCHHWFSFSVFLICPVLFSTFCLVAVLLYVIWLYYIYFAYNITWVVVYLFLAVFVFVLDIMWYMYYRDYGLYFGGGSYSSVYVPPPLYVFPVVLIVCIPTFFSSLLCFVCLFLDSHLPLVFPFVWVLSTLGWKLLGVCAYAFYHMQPYVDLEMCILNILYY